MKLKNQLNLLATFITAIPCACIIFLCINSYLRSQRRLLLDGSQEVRVLDSSNMTAADFNMFIKNVQLLPRDVEIALAHSQEYFAAHGAGNDTWNLVGVVLREVVGGEGMRVRHGAVPNARNVRSPHQLIRPSKILHNL